MSELYSRIERFAKERGYKNVTELCSIAGVPRSNLSELKAGRTRSLSSGVVRKLATALNVSVDELEGSYKPVTELSADLILAAMDDKMLSSLSLEQKQDLVNRLLNDINRQQRNLRLGIEKPATKVIELYSTAFAAGPGEPDTAERSETLEVPEGLRADFAVRVTGDSMEPYIRDRSIVYGEKRQPLDGEVGCFIVAGEYLIKQFCQDNRGTVYLFSLNRKRKDLDRVIKNAAEADIYVVGTIRMNERLPLPND